MALRPLLSRLSEHPDGAALIADGGRAFVSQSMRPYVVAALAEGAAADRPTLVVAGDDRQARDLAADLRHWLADYARAWSRKDVAALQRMGQVRGDAEAAQLERYFASIGALDVDVRILSLTVEGEHASVEFERTDTVTDPSGRRQQLRLPPIRKRIERTPDGFRFTPQGGRG